MVDCSYVDEDYYDYYKNTPHLPQKSSPNPQEGWNEDYYLNPNSSHNVYRSFQEGQLSSVFYRPEKIEEIFKTAASKRESDPEYKRGYFSAWVLTVHELSRRGAPHQTDDTDADSTNTKEVVLLNLIHVKACSSPFSHQDLEDNYKLMLKANDAKSLAEK